MLEGEWAGAAEGEQVGCGDGADVRIEAETDIIESMVDHGEVVTERLERQLVRSSVQDNRLPLTLRVAGTQCMELGIESKAQCRREERRWDVGVESDCGAV